MSYDPPDSSGSIDNSELLMDTTPQLCIVSYICSDVVFRKFSSAAYLSTYFSIMLQLVMSSIYAEKNRSASIDNSELLMDTSPQLCIFSYISSDVVFRKFRAQHIYPYILASFCSS